MFLQVVSIAKLGFAERIGLICRYETLGHLNYINILIGLVESKEELSYGLPYAAGGDHLEEVQRLINAKVDPNAAASRYGPLKYTQSLRAPNLISTCWFSSSFLTIKPKIS